MGEELDMSSLCLVSIITPCYNSAKYISKTIESVINQRFICWEMLIIDDCSTDNSTEIINEWCRKDDRIKLIKLEKNSGAAVARNKAIQMAKGRYIAFLDSDDSWFSDKLELQVAFMQENGIDFSYTAYEKVDEKGHVLVEKVGVSNRLSYTDLLKKCEIGCLSAIYDTSRLGKIYMPDIRKRQDLGLWLKILKITPYAYGLNRVLGQYTVRSNSISANKRNAAAYTWRLYRDVEKLSLLKCIYYFSFYAVNGVLRTKFPKFAKFIGILK